MVDVQRGNVYLTVSEEEVDKYMAKGYSVVDAYGNVIKQSIPTELGELQRAYSEHVAEIKRLKDEIASLKDLLTQQPKAGAEKSPAVKADIEPEDTKETTDNSTDGWDDWADAEEVEETTAPKKKSSKSKS